jgi:hypothetical protein
MYEFLIAPQAALPEHIDVTLIFGRKSQHLAQIAATALQRSTHAVISGEVGKDSGDNPIHGIPEDEWLLAEIAARGAPVDIAQRDLRHPRNGLDNARNMLGIVRNDIGLTEVGSIAAVIHSTQVRRLGGTLLRQIDLNGPIAGKVSLLASPYPFDPESPYDQYEAAFEIVRIDVLSRGSDAIMERPEDLDAYLPDARRAISHLDQGFSARGIRNWSTADDTIRSISPDDLVALFHVTAQQA